MSCMTRYSPAYFSSILFNPHKVVLSGKIFAFKLETEGSTSAVYTAIFLFYASSLFIGLVLYLQAKDRLD